MSNYNDSKQQLQHKIIEETLSNNQNCLYSRLICIYLLQNKFNRLLSFEKRTYNNL